MSEPNGNGRNWKSELASGLAKGGPAAILLGCVLYWMMIVANNKFDRLIELMQGHVSMSNQQTEVLRDIRDELSSDFTYEAPIRH